jgi:hypothetical protein
MGDQAVGDGRVEDSRLKVFERGERFGVSLTGFVRVAADDFLEAAVLGHEQAPSEHHRPPATQCCEMACDMNNREGSIPFAIGTPTGADVP